MRKAIAGCSSTTRHFSAVAQHTAIEKEHPEADDAARCGDAVLIQRQKHPDVSYLFVISNGKASSKGWARCPTSASVPSLPNALHWLLAT